MPTGKLRSRLGALILLGLIVGGLHWLPRSIASAEPPSTGPAPQAAPSPAYLHDRAAMLAYAHQYTQGGSRYTNSDGCYFGAASTCDFAVTGTSDERTLDGAHFVGC